MIRLQLEPIDTLFFRDSTPFAAGSASQDEAGGLFPPLPTTVVGALRAALARGQGWNGLGRWPKDMDPILGDGPEDLGALRFEGPFLLRNGEPLFQAPRHLLGSDKGDRWNPALLIRPGPGVTCDLGEGVRLPEIPPHGSNPEGLDPGEGWWLTLEGLETVLRWELPTTKQVVASRELWREEPRIGLQRDPDTRTARDGMLFGTRHIRLSPGVSLGVQIQGLPNGWKRPLGQAIPLGGEGRVAECLPWESPFNPEMPIEQILSSGRMTIIALSPLDLDQPTLSGQKVLGELGNAQVVSTCLDRPLRLGGWNSLERCPVALHSFLPAGSVLFCKADDRKQLQSSLETLGNVPHLGRRSDWGFGAVALGTWPENLEVVS
jgi:CRISPR-associated protein Cmr3